MSTRNSVLDLIKERIVILDGAMGSLLIDQGLEPGTPPEYWNVSHPERIQKIHSDYFNAGSDVVFTNTFGGSSMKLSAHKHGHSVEKYNKAAVELAREVCSEGATGENRSCPGPRRGRSPRKPSGPGRIRRSPPPDTKRPPQRAVR